MLQKSSNFSFLHQAYIPDLTAKRHATTRDNLAAGDSCLV
jgi:hypothetical protein